MKNTDQVRALRTQFPLKIVAGGWLVPNTACGWLAAMLSVNQKPGCKIDNS